MTLHGGMGLDHTCFRPSLDSLGDVRSLIYFDQLGNGRSDRPSTLTGGLDEWAESANALRSGLGYDRVVLLGHSFGAYTALEYALRFPDTLEGLILCSGAPALDYFPVALANARARATDEQLALLMQIMGEPVADDATYRAGWNTVRSVYFRHYDPAIGAAMDAATQYSAYAFNLGMRALAAFNALPRLHEIKVPTLLVSGDDDWISPVVQGADRLHAGLPNAERVIIKDAGHFPFIEQPQAFDRAVRDWLSRLR